MKRYPSILYPYIKKNHSFCRKASYGEDPELRSGATRSEPCWRSTPSCTGLRGLQRRDLGVHGLFGNNCLKLDTKATVPNVGNAMILRELHRNKQAVIGKHVSALRPHFWFCCGLMGAGRDVARWSCFSAFWFSHILSPGPQCPLV